MDVDILGHTYKIKEVECEDNDDIGKCNFLKGTIEIGKNNEDIKGEALLHEVGEAINWWGDIRLDHHQICLMITFLYGILAQNTEFRDYIWSTFRQNNPDA